MGINSNCPKISIITITFNSEKTVEGTIKSVISQDYDNLEYIIIDGASKDKTLEVVNRYRDKIATIVSEPDKGISDAFNKGIEHATGDIIGIINSDDILMPGALKVIGEYFSPDIDVYRGRLIVNNPSTGYKFSTGKPTLKCDVSNYLGLTVNHPSTFVAKKAYEKVGQYKVDIRYIMDIDMLFRLTKAGCSFIYVPYDLALFNLGGATSDALYKKVKERYKVVRENGGSFCLAFSIATKCMIKDIIKQIVDRCFGENFKNILLRRKRIDMSI